MSDNPPDRNTPLRLKDAAALAFPNGGITAASLRREAAKGRLVIERIAGKDFVTLAAIDEMRALCRVQATDIAPSPQPKFHAATSTKADQEEIKAAMAGCMAAIERSKAAGRERAQLKKAERATLVYLSKKPIKRTEPR